MYAKVMFERLFLTHHRRSFRFVDGLHTTGTYTGTSTAWSSVRGIQGQMVQYMWAVCVVATDVRRCRNNQHRVSRATYVSRKLWTDARNPTNRVLHVSQNGTNTKLRSDHEGLTPKITQYS